MAQTFNILVAERNRHVRDFIRRELAAEGYQVESVRDGHELFARLTTALPPDILILDLEIPFLSEEDLLARLYNDYPQLPIVIHSFLPEDLHPDQGPQAAAILEKKEDIQRLKETVAQVLAKFYPTKYPAVLKT